MQIVIVYRVDFGTKTKDPIGVVFEKRKTERANNNYDLLRVARKRFAMNTGDASRIFIDVNKTWRATHSEPTIECPAE